MLIVGLTGGIASGKSTVSNRLHEQYNLTIVDADKIAKEIVEPGKPAYNKIVSHFQPNISNLVDPKTKTLNRPALGKYVFENKSELQVLNSITHPAVRRQMIWEIIKSWFSFDRMVILDVPLLFEAKLDVFCGVNVCIICDGDVQLERLMARNPELSAEDCKNRIKNQMSNEDKISKSDVVIENNSTRELLYEEVDKTVNQLMPSTLWSYLEVLIPPLGLASALILYLKNTFFKKGVSGTAPIPKLQKTA
ncbi:unnamed protein product [Ambrosiozyma monospora]|uniref:Unnamed protein product n=1 Tax=Ambrosiozyma monospora TaxID=43982 RepID=A0A9W6YY76_AMBMO|nr:unnamed protein product [Ambrosiozyma monospora]